MRIGVDAGGTFTDFIVLHGDGRMETFKLPSNPRAPAKVILEGLQRAARNEEQVTVVHGSTVATNALLERKGARTAFVTTAGFEDLLEIGRQNRKELYNLTPAPRRLLAERRLCFGVNERAYHDGAIAKRPSSAELLRLKNKLIKARVESVAICFLHAYRNPANERAVARALKEFQVCYSHEICPEFREYERASTTFLNAYVGPLMEAYLKELSAARGFRISIMQSNGGSLSASQAAKSAVRTVLSGPAGGVIGATKTAALSGFSRVMGFDMGGTSTDVSLCDGAPRETTEAMVDGLPVRVPMLDIHTVGAGGGSIARVDAGGLLRVGPESAGADPGPACYGKGNGATVTDAHVVLGRISASQLLGGAMTIDPERAARAVDALAKAMKMDRTHAAAGIVRVANANMERAIRAISVERGYDPRDFALVAFGGGGGLHACEIAQELGVKTVIVPAQAGALSALGMLLADEVRDYAAGALGHADPVALFPALERRALRETPAAMLERSADVRYLGQSYELNVSAEPLTLETLGSAFHREHQRVYGYSTAERAVQIVTVRVRARVKTPPFKTGAKTRSAKSVLKQITRKVWTGGAWRTLPVLAREQATSSAKKGPALLLDYGSTTLAPPGWLYRLDRSDNLLLRRAKSV